jgi:hypothetical protein
MSVINFKGKQCRMDEHDSCHGSWIGLGFRFKCDCMCHVKENNAAMDRCESPRSITETASPVNTGVSREVV